MESFFVFFKGNGGDKGIVGERGFLLLVFEYLLGLLSKLSQIRIMC